MTLSDLFLCLLTMFLWGAQVTAVKIAGHEIPTFVLLTVRFIIVSLCLLPFSRKGSPQILAKMSVVALFSTSIHFALLYLGISRIPASTSAVIYQLSPIFTVILARLVLKDRLSISAIVGIALSFLGVTMLFGGVDLKANMVGGGLVALAALSFATGTILMKKLGPFDPVSMNAYSALIAVPIMLLFSLTTESDGFSTLVHASRAAWLALLYASVSGGILGFAIWYKLLNRYPVSTLSPYSLLVPVFAVAVSEFFLHEGLTMRFAGCAAMVIIGVAIAQFKLLERFGGVFLKARTVEPAP